MKQLITLFFFLFVTIGYSQGVSKINFSIENKQIRTVDPTSKLKLPLELKFTKDFQNLSLVISDSIGEITQQRFGAGIFSPMIDGSYSLNIDSEGTVDIASDDERKITGKIIKLKIGDNTPIVLTINKNSGNSGGGNPDLNTPEGNYTPGFVYYDALKIASKNESVGLRIDLMESYGINMSNVDNNPYLSELYKSLKAQGSVQGGLNLLAPIGSTDITNFAVGLSRFLAERAKEELNEAFFNKMKEQLNAYPELKTVFPQTTTFLNVIENYSYSSVLQVLKEAFETDVQNLPENLYQIKNLTPSDCASLDSCSCKKENCKQHSDCKKGCEKCRCENRLERLSAFFKTLNGQWIGVGMFTVKEAIQSTNPANLLRSITESAELSGLKKTSQDSMNYASYNLVSSIELGNFLSQSLLSKNTGQVWIHPTEFGALFKTKDAFQIYLGLLLALQDQSPEKISFYKARNATITLGDLLRDAKSQEEKLANLVKGVYNGFNSANNAVKKMMEANSKSMEADPQALYDYYTTFTNSLKQIVSTPLIKELTGKDLEATYNQVAQFLNPAVDMAYNISTKKYSVALYDAVLLLNNIHAPVFEKPVTNSFVKYGTLISTVANAESSDEVKQAIEASVLPAGSSAIKRKSAWSISVNAYVGLYGGWAHSTLRDTSFNPSTNTFDTITRSNVYGTYGLYAPIGLSFNRGFKCGLKNSWGFTLSTQLLDVGALVNFYMSNGDGASLPTDFKVRLSDILSPGLQLGINLPRCPITLMGGIQYVPALNKPSQIASSSQLSPVAWRAQIGIVVDIPLYNLKVWDFKK